MAEEKNKTRKHEGPLDKVAGVLEDLAETIEDARPKAGSIPHHKGPLDKVAEVLEEFSETIEDAREESRK